MTLKDELGKIETLKETIKNKKELYDLFKKKVEKNKHVLNNLKKGDMNLDNFMWLINNMFKRYELENNLWSEYINISENYLKLIQEVKNRVIEKK